MLVSMLVFVLVLVLLRVLLLGLGLGHLLLEVGDEQVDHADHAVALLQQQQTTDH